MFRIVVVAASRAAGVGRRPPGGRAGTAVLRSVRSRCRGDQGVLPATSVSRQHRLGLSQRPGSRGRRSRREEDLRPAVAAILPGRAATGGHGRRPPHARAVGTTAADLRRCQTTSPSRPPHVRPRTHYAFVKSGVATPPERFPSTVSQICRRSLRACRNRLRFWVACLSPVAALACASACPTTGRPPSQSDPPSSAA
jgi:hypothetical protein